MKLIILFLAITVVACKKDEPIEPTVKKPDCRCYVEPRNEPKLNKIP